MRTALTIPDDLYDRADEVARRRNKSCSDIVSEALRDYLARLAPEDITESMDRVLDEVGQAEDKFSAAAARRVLEGVEW
ncbi:MAG: ribbon-helix-helix protein, CopG family [Candidatus Hydrogenedentes bacterium]|nr:ribbon-helix-helix protein, CopG family [Candidatus Hydrogenedentota bacterium]